MSFCLIPAQKSPDLILPVTVILPARNSSGGCCENKQGMKYMLYKLYIWLKKVLLHVETIKVIDVHSSAHSGRIEMITSIEIANFNASNAELSIVH